MKWKLQKNDLHKRCAAIFSNRFKPAMSGRKGLILAITFALLIFGSCRKDPNFDQLSSNLVVATNIDTAANFSSYKTYYISDTIAIASSSTRDTIWYDDNAKQLVEAVKSNMNARGFTFVDRGSNPDLGFSMGVIKNTDVGVYYPGWWWGWWYPWYGGGYYPYYPWSVAYVITTGTIIIDMLDVKNISIHDPQLRVLWTADMSGALGSSTSYNIQGGINGINQAFIQSPAIETH